jgi:hypothetical protein
MLQNSDCVSLYYFTQVGQPGMEIMGKMLFLSEVVTYVHYHTP